MIDNTWDNYKPENGDYFKTNSVSEETLYKFAEHFKFYDVEHLIKNHIFNPECCFKESKFIGRLGERNCFREINIPEILYHINKPKKSVCDGNADIDEDYVFDCMNFQPKEGEFFDLNKHTPEQRKWLQDNLKTYCSSDFLGSWCFAGKKG